jgi:hydrogenase maturation protease
MHPLQHQLQTFHRQPTLWLGIGTATHADDAAGLILAQTLIQSGSPNVVNAGSNPERWIASAHLAPFAHLVFLDAVELGAPPGSVVLLPADDIASRFPQVSTHKISLGLLARYVESQHETRAWLLGIQPQTLRHHQKSSHRNEEQAGPGGDSAHPPESPTPNPQHPKPPPIGLAPSPLSAPVQRTVELLHQLITAPFRSPSRAQSHPPSPPNTRSATLVASPP